MIEDIDRKIVAIRMIDGMRECAQVMNNLAINAPLLMAEEDANKFKTRVGEFLGYIYCDIYHERIVREFPELAGSVESDTDEKSTL